MALIKYFKGNTSPFPLQLHVPSLRKLIPHTMSFGTLPELLPSKVMAEIVINGCVSTRGLLGKGKKNLLPSSTHHRIIY